MALSQLFAVTQAARAVWRESEKRERIAEEVTHAAIAAGKITPAQYGSFINEFRRQRNKAEKIERDEAYRDAMAHPGRSVARAFATPAILLCVLFIGALAAAAIDIATRPTTASTFKSLDDCSDGTRYLGSQYRCVSVDKTTLWRVEEQK